MVISLRARAWHERPQPASRSSSIRTAAEQRPCSTWPEITRILHVPQPPPRQPYLTLAPDPRIAASTVSSGRHGTVSPTGLSVIAYTRPRQLEVSWLWFSLTAVAANFLRINAQECLVQLLRII